MAIEAQWCLDNASARFVRNAAELMITWAARTQHHISARNLSQLDFELHSRCVPPLRGYSEEVLADPAPDLDSLSTFAAMLADVWRFLLHQLEQPLAAGKA